MRSSPHRADRYLSGFIWDDFRELLTGSPCHADEAKHGGIGSYSINKVFPRFLYFWIFTKVFCCDKVFFFQTYNLIWTSKP
jgi:hypothetical protein